MNSHRQGEWLGSPNYSPGRDGHDMAIAPSWVVIHTMVGTIESANARFQQAGQQASAHYGVGSTGRLVQWVDESDAAWHAGVYNVNLDSIGIEHEDHGDYNGPRPDALYAASRCAGQGHLHPVRHTDPPWQRKRRPVRHHRPPGNRLCDRLPGRPRRRPHHPRGWWRQCTCPGAGSCSACTWCDSQPAEPSYWPRLSRLALGRLRQPVSDQHPACGNGADGRLVQGQAGWWCVVERDHARGRVALASGRLRTPTSTTEVLTHRTLTHRLPQHLYRLQPLHLRPRLHPRRCRLLRFQRPCRRQHLSRCSRSLPTRSHRSQRQLRRRPFLRHLRSPAATGTFDRPAVGAGGAPGAIAIHPRVIGVGAVATALWRPQLAPADEVRHHRAGRRRRRRARCRRLPRRLAGQRPHRPTRLCRSPGGVGWGGLLRSPGRGQLDPQRRDRLDGSAGPAGARTRPGRATRRPGSWAAQQAVTPPMIGIVYRIRLLDDGTCALTQSSWTSPGSWPRPVKPRSSLSSRGGEIIASHTNRGGCWHAAPEQSKLPHEPSYRELVARKAQGK